MSKELLGAPVVVAIKDEIAKDIQWLENKDIHPTLAVVRLGKQPDDIAYENSIVRNFEKQGLQVRKITLDRDITQLRLIDEIYSLNVNSDIHGVLIFRPLPEHIDENEICKALSPKKDIDGITFGSLGGVFAGVKLGYPPCTAQACMEVFNHYNINLEGKSAVVIGRSLVVGKPVGAMMTNENATVTLCHTRTANTKEITKNADIIIAAAGVANMVDKSYLSSGQIVIDVGINVDDNGKMCGDVNYADVIDIVDKITPVPRGIGPVTTAVLAKNLVSAARRTLD